MKAADGHVITATMATDEERAHKKRALAAVAEKIEPHFRVLIYVAAYTGMRAGELPGADRSST